MAKVRLDVTCGRCERVLGTWHDEINEKYPFWCENCGDSTSGGKHPWKLIATIETSAAEQAHLAKLERDSRELRLLEAAGVDSWEGYSRAFEADEDRD